MVFTILLGAVVLVIREVTIAWVMWPHICSPDLCNFESLPQSRGKIIGRKMKGWKLGDMSDVMLL